MRVAIVVIFLLVIVRVSLFFFTKQPLSDGQTISFTTTLFEEPDVKGTFQRFRAHVPSGDTVSITATFPPLYSFGQELNVSGPVKLLRVHGASKQKGRVLMYLPKITLVEKSNSPLLAVVSFVRQHVRDVFHRTLPQPSASLILGIVFGIVDGMPKSFMDDLRLSGVTHVIAASGMNVTMVAGFLSGLFGMIFRRHIAIIVSIMGIFFYAFLAGLEPSIVRASIMASLAFAAQLLGRGYLALYGLFLTGAVMLLVAPRLLLEVGFQLSFLATLGLILLAPALPFRRSVVGESMVTTISAQAFTLPILFLNFGNYSLWSVVANAAVLWTIPTIMVFGGVGAILGMIALPIGQFVLYLSLPFLLYFQKVVEMFARLGGVVSIERFPWQLTLGYYLIVVSALIHFYKRRP